MKYRFLLVLVVFLPLSGHALAEDKGAMAKSLQQYIQDAKASQPPLETSQGSLYTVSGVNSWLFTDVKARRTNDIITIRVLESTVAQSTADAQTSRNSAVALAVPNFFGVEQRSGDVSLDSLVSADTSLQFKGDGSTNRSGSVVALLSGRVADVLPNGDMVIEAVKEVKINNERQVLRIFGVVRQKDLGFDNVVLSGAIANMMLQIDGKGVLSDNLKQGWLFKVITKIWPF